MADITGLEPDETGKLAEADQDKFGKFCSELDAVEDSLYVVLVAVVKQAMRAAGEDADNATLVALRVTQAAYSINSRAQREWNVQARGGTCPYHVTKRVVPPEGGEDPATYHIAGTDDPFLGTVAAYRAGRFEFFDASGAKTGWHGEWLRAVAAWRKVNGELWP